MYRWLPYGTMCFGVSALVMVGYSRSLMCAPNGIVLDIDSHIFEVTTIYEHGEKATLFEHVRDVVASLAVEALVILFWHGCWSLLDTWSASIGLDHTISSWYATTFGVVVSAILAVIQFPLLAICKSSEVPSIFKLIANSLFSIVAGFG